MMEKSQESWNGYIRYITNDKGRYNNQRINSSGRHGIHLVIEL